MSWNSGGWTVAAPKVRVNGQEHEVEPTAPFVETVQQMAREAGIVHFAVYTDGTEVVSPDQAPADFSQVSTVEIRAYQRGG